MPVNPQRISLLRRLYFFLDLLLLVRGGYTEHSLWVSATAELN